PPRCYCRQREVTGTAIASAEAGSGRMRMTKQWLAFGVAAALLALPVAGHAEKVLRVVPHADLRIVDPHTSTATISQMHGQMICDQVFAWYANLTQNPELVAHYEISPGRLVYTFTLRPGLKFHDGQPVTTRDVIASLKRWAARNVLGQALLPHVE